MSNKFPQTKSTGLWLRHGLFVILAYILGCYFIAFYVKSADTIESRKLRTQYLTPMTSKKKIPASQTAPAMEVNHPLSAVSKPENFR